MSTEITRFIPLASRTSEQTDFPTIAFRSAARDLAKDTDLIARHAHGEIADPHGLERLEQIMQLGRRAAVDEFARRCAGYRSGGYPIGFCLADGLVSRLHGSAPDELART